MAVAEMAEEQSFEQMWKEASMRFEEKTKKSLSQSNNRSLDDIMGVLESRFNTQDSNENSKQQRLKGLASNVLKFIQLLGGIAAQGASVVFGSACLCFNAMSFLIEIPAKISGFYDDLERLFNEISTFMKQFKIYQRIEQFAEVGIELKQGTHNLMILFVDICAISIDVLSGSRWHQTKTWAKIALFDNDSGIQAKLEEFKGIINHQSQISGAITLEHVLKSEHELTSSVNGVFEMLKKASEDSRKLLEKKSQEIQDELKFTHDDVKIVKAGNEVLIKDVNDRISENQQLKDYNEICSKLRVVPDTAKNSEKEIDQMRSDRLSSTGLWLKDLEVYKHWMNFESGVGSPLLLRGSSGSGKSSLAFTILDDLKVKYNTVNNSSMRVSWAFYRFVNNEKSRDDAIRDSLKSMAAQIASQSLDFSKSLCLHLKNKDLSFSKDMSVEDLFKELIPPPNMKDTLDKAYVLLFDGLDQLSENHANQLFSAIFTKESSMMRIVMTGTEEIFQNCSNLSGHNLDSVPNIRLVDHNKPDIKRFIDLELNKILQGSAPGILRISNSIRNDLPEIVEGNFNDVRQIIERVNEAVKSDLSEEETIKLISVENLENTTGRLINDFNHSLNVQEIDQLNELLKWTIYAYKYMSMDEMRAALFLRTKRIPLQSLEDKVAQRYSKFFRTDEYGFEMRNAYLENYFRESERKNQLRDAEGNDDPKISMKITIDHVNLSKVQRFFWDLSEKVVLNKFEFTNSLTSLRPTATISANKTEAHLTLAQRCFDLLLDEPNTETEILSPYALINLLSHLLALREEVQNQSLTSAERIKIVDDLVTLLQSPNCIEKHLTKRFFENESWLDETSDLEVIQAWLRDSEATDKLNRKEISWLKQVTSGGRLLALNDIAVMITRQWLCHRTWSAELPFGWIDVFLDRLENDPVNDQATGSSQSGGQSKDSFKKEVAIENLINQPARKNMTDCARILRAAEWAEHQAGISKDSLWYERLGITYLMFEEIEPSKEAFLMAKSFPNYSWKVHEGLADAHVMRGLNNLAVQEMEILFAYLRGKEGLTADETASFVNCLIKSAKWQIKLQNIPDAIDKLREAIRLNEHYYQSHVELIKLYVDTGQGHEALTLLDEMGKQPAKGNDLSQLGSMLLEFSQSLEYSETVFLATRHHDMFQVVLQALKNASNYALNNKATSNVIDLLLCHGVALAGYSGKEDCLESALTKWTECCELGFQPGNWDKHDTALSAARYIFCYHFLEIRRTPYDFEIHVAKLKKLIEVTRSFYYAPRLRSMLACLYKLSGRQDAAQELLLNDMKSGIDILSDDDPENDFMGYDIIANVLMHTGDDLNALSAWSLYGPSERYKEADRIDSEKRDAEPVGYFCDGRCNVTLTYADSIWFCKMCDDVQFDDKCLKRLQQGTLARFVCSPDHEWLLVPSWVDEFQATGKGRVRVEGELQDGKRVGGRIVPVEEWLDMIREKWGINKPTPEGPTENDE